MPVVSDDFTNSDTTALATHNANWVQHPASGVNAQIWENRVRPNNNPFNLCLHYRSETPPSADYSVQATVRWGDYTSTIIGLAGRIDTSAETLYLAQYNQGNYRIYKSVAGTQTELAGPTAGPTAGDTDVTLKLEMIGTAIKLYSNSVEILSATDSSISAVGKGGIWAFPLSGPASERWDDFVITNLGAGATSFPPIRSPSPMATILTM
jgi:hypothetical protein